MAKQISADRKGAYYLGMGLMLVGGILFACGVLTAIASFGDTSNIESTGKTMMGFALAGVVLIMAGGFIRTVGARGLAGSGLILDPEQAREEFQPYSRMAGGMLKDTLEAADIELGGRAERVVMVKCTACETLNDEDSKFCKKCGEKL